MNLFIKIALILCLFSCAGRVHHNSASETGLKRIEYCGGDLWGYVGPLAADQKNGTFQTAFTGVSYLTGSEKGEKTLLFTYALEMYGAVDLKFESNELEILVNGKKLPKKNLEVAAQRVAYSPSEHYPADKYSLRLLNGEKNTWEVTKLNPAFKHLFTGKPKIVTLAKDQKQVVKDGIFQYPHEDQIKKTVLISVEVLLPASRDLEDTMVQVTVPAMTYKGIKLNAQKFEFAFDKEAWQSRAAKWKGRCPSLEELFRWNRLSF
jgi:hypothetical protein